MMPTSRKRSVFADIFKKYVLGPGRTKCVGPPISHIDNPKLELINSRILTSDNVEIGISIIKRRKMDHRTLFLVVCHGVGCNRGSYAGLFDEGQVLDRNVCVLLFDYREFGDSGGSFTKEGGCYDLDACIKHLRKCYSSEKVHLYGHSFGAAIVFEYIKHVTEQGGDKLYNKVVCVSAFTSFEDVCVKFSVWRALTLIPGFKKSLDAHFAYQSIASVLLVDRGKLHLFHGKDDELILPSHSMLLSKTSQAPLHLTGDDHVSIIGSRDVWDRIFDFLTAEDQT